MIRNQTLYGQGNAYWLTLKDQFGIDAANRAAAAAATGDETELNKTLSNIRLAAKEHPGNSIVTDAEISSKDASFDERTSTASIFADQITTDPLAAPLASANNLAKNSLLAFIKAPAFVLVLAVVAFFWLGGANVLKKQLAKAA